MTRWIRTFVATWLVLALALPLTAQAQDAPVLKPSDHPLRGARGELGLGGSMLVLAPILSFFVVRTGDVYIDCGGSHCGDLADQKRRRHLIGGSVLGVGLGAVGAALLVHGGVRLRREKRALRLTFADAGVSFSGDSAQVSAMFRF